MSSSSARKSDSRVVPGMVALCGLLGALFFSGIAGMRAETALLDFPLRWEDPLPEWIPAVPIEWEDREFRRLEVPWSGIGEDRRVLVSVVFREGDSERLSAYWVPEGSDTGVGIVDNLVEGIEGWNQRVFVLPPEWTNQAGSLVFDSEGSSRVVQRLFFQILSPGEAFTLPTKADDAIFATGGRFYFQTELENAGGPPPPDAWFGQFSEAWLQEQTEPLEGGLEFAVEIQPAPARALIRFEVNGRGGAPDLWVNGQKIEGVSVEIPPLRDPAYVLENHAGDFVYAGWRAGWAALPTGLLRPGENTFTFAPDDSSDALRSAKLELFFPKVSVSTDGTGGRPTVPAVSPDLPATEEYPEIWRPEASGTGRAPAGGFNGASEEGPGLFRTSFF